MLHVSHKISIGDAIFASDGHTRLLGLRASASLEVPVNECRIVFSPPVGLFIATQDPVTVELGYEDGLMLIFSGAVADVEWAIDRVMIHATGLFRSLLAAPFNLVFERSRAGDMVADIIGRLGLVAGTIEDGIEFPSYVMGENQSAYDHLHELARRCGFDLYANVDDQVMFAPYNPIEVYQFRYGVNILASNSEETVVSVTGMEVYGESPMSFGQGTDAYSWLTKQDVLGQAGDASGIVKRLAVPTAKTLDAAAQIAGLLLAADVVKRRGTLRVLGAPGLKLGDAIQISGMPEIIHNGTFKPTAVVQMLNPKQGFQTSIRWEET